MNSTLSMGVSSRALCGSELSTIAPGHLYWLSCLGFGTQLSVHSCTDTMYCVVTSFCSLRFWKSQGASAPCCPGGCGNFRMAPCHPKVPRGVCHDRTALVHGYQRNCDDPNYESESHSSCAWIPSPARRVLSGCVVHAAQCTILAQYYVTHQSQR